jgi:hypothetical protein
VRRELVAKPGARERPYTAGSRLTTPRALRACKMPRAGPIDSGNLKYGIDFRSVYQTLIRDRLQGDAASVLGATYPELPFINKA